jgi:ferric-dicitrate binding protein FerR (iron transport regulator)
MRLQALPNGRATAPTGSHSRQRNFRALGLFLCACTMGAVVVAFAPLIDRQSF